MRKLHDGKSRVKKSKNEAICIGPRFLFEISPLCYTLYERKVSEKGNEYLDTVGYYTTMESMYARLVDLNALTDCRNFQDICQRQIDLKEWISQINVDE
jgi:hypothetical protein